MWYDGEFQITEQTSKKLVEAVKRIWRGSMTFFQHVRPFCC